MGTELIKLIIEHGPNAITTNGTATATTMTSIVECPHEKVGRIIGSKGDTIKELQSRTGSRIQIQQDKDLPDGVPRKVKVGLARTHYRTRPHTHPLPFPRIYPLHTLSCTFLRRPSPSLLVGA